LGIQEVALGAALVVMGGQEEDMVEVVVMVAVAMVVTVDQDMVVVLVVHMEEMGSMAEQGAQENRSQGVMKVKVTDR
jgi:aspartyl aminopeptidase